MKKRLLVVFLFPYAASLSICVAGDVSASTYHGVFCELSGTNITPEGSLAEILRRQRDGLGLQRKASGYPYDTDLWVGKLPEGQWKDYEQTAYFLDGSYRCGLLLKDKVMIDQALASINFVLDHPEPDGKLGPTVKDYNRKLSRDVAGYPWTRESSPVRLTVPAKKIPSWVETPENENPPLPEPPLHLAPDTEEITLIPYGAAQLRVSVFPIAE